MWLFRLLIFRNHTIHICHDEKKARDCEEIYVKFI